MYQIQPLAHDALRYFAMADLLSGKPTDAWIRWTPLFLPVFLHVTSTYGIPYVTAGIALQVMSYCAVISLASMIVYKESGFWAAYLTGWVLAVTLPFVYNLTFIMTEYPFMACLLGVILYVLSKPKPIVLSLLFGLLISIKIQGVLFLLAIALLYRSQRWMLLTMFVVPVFYLFFNFVLFGKYAQNQKVYLNEDYTVYNLFNNR